jgi:Zn-dependent peptidase ImmA (M78 family)
VYEALELTHPTEAPIEVIAHMRGALVRVTPTRGAQANLVRIGNKAIISVAGALVPGQRRFAIAHELGHFEVHPHISYLGLCTSADLLANYDLSGHEDEANAFASEFLMPERLYAQKCDVAAVRWEVIEKLAEEFQVSLSAAAVRFVELTCDRVAVVCSKHGQVVWSRRTRDFYFPIPKGKKLDQWSLAYDYFAKGSMSKIPETVSASAWVNTSRHDAELVEHSMAMPNYGVVMSLLWIRHDANF